MIFKIKFKRWTPKEDDILRNNLERLKYKEIGDLLERTEKGVRRRVMRLKLRKRKPRDHKKVALMCIDCNELFTTFEYLAKREGAPKLRCDDCSKIHQEDLAENWRQKNKDRINKRIREYNKAFGKKREAKRKERNKKRIKIWRARNKKRQREYEKEYINRPGVRERKNARRIWGYWNVPGYREKRLAQRRNWAEENKEKITEYNKNQWKKLKNNPVKYKKYKKKKKEY